MKRFYLAIALVLILAGVIFAGTMDNGIFFATPTTPCNGTSVSKTWGPFQQDISIESVQVQTMLDYMSSTPVQDVNATLRRQSDSALLACCNHDDYVNGGEVRICAKSWSGNTFLLKAGDSLILQGQCMDGKQTVHGTWAATVWTVQP